jgi:hypothetical protein
VQKPGDILKDKGVSPIAEPEARDKSPLIEKEDWINGFA